jgi:molecular chaperone DnaK
MSRILGIDLGTTNSVAAFWDGSKPRLIRVKGGAKLLPSVVSFNAIGDVVVGEAARHRAVTHPTETIFSAKRFIGKRFDAAAIDREEVPYEIVEGEQGQILFELGQERWSPEEISAFVLRELKSAAEDSLGETVKEVVITVPAHFNDAQRAATRKAAGLAGLEVRRLLNEPTAAALAYGLDHMDGRDRIVVVYDFGGGTFDVSILSIGEDVVEVVATSGDRSLGGDIIDARIVQWMVRQARTMNGFPPDEDAATLQRLREMAEEAKIALSARATVDLTLPILSAHDGRSFLQCTLSRDDLETIIGDLVDRTLVCCRRALTDAGREPEEIGDIVLAGGSTRIPLVRRRVEEYFRKAPLTTVDPDEVVAVGAAVQAGIISGQVKGVVLVDVTSLSLGIETHDGATSVMTPRNTVLPVEVSRIFTTTEDRQTTVEFHVVQGESKWAKDNGLLGRFTLEGLEPAPAGTPQIAVTFSIDVNGMVLVGARDRGTGAEKRVAVSIGTAAGRDKSAERVAISASRASETSRIPARAPDVPPPTLAALEDADLLLAQAGERMTRVDRASLTKITDHVRHLSAGSLSTEEVMRSGSALAKVLARVRGSKGFRLSA